MVRAPVKTRVIAYRDLLLSQTAVGVFLAGFAAAYWVVALNITWLANYLLLAQHLTINPQADRQRFRHTHL